MRKLIRKFESLPLFVQYFFLMGLIVTCMLAAIAYSNTITEKEVINNYEKELQNSLNKSVTAFSTDIQNLSAVPNAIQNTQAYEYFIGIRKENVQKSPHLLVMIRKVLCDLFYFQNNTLEAILYIPSINAVVTRNTVSFNAKKFFASALAPSGYDVETFISVLQTSENKTLLPMVDLMLNGNQTRAMGIICHPDNMKFSVLFLYSEAAILDYFNYSDLPRGSAIIITNESDVLMEYGDKKTEMGEQITLNSDSVAPSYHVQLTIPSDNYLEILLPVKKKGYQLIVVSIIIGVILCFLLSASFTRPIKSLLSMHEKKGGSKGSNIQNGNEYVRLRIMMDSSEEEKLALQMKLRDTLVTKAFSGVLLNSEEEGHFRSYFQKQEMGYRIAVFESSEKANSRLSQLLMGDEDSEEYFCCMISATETVLLIEDGDDTISLLSRATSALNFCFEGEKVRCGLSSRMASYEHLINAVHQAHIALLNSNEFNVYLGQPGRDSLSIWTGMERLYQSILANDEDGAIRLIQSIAVMDIPVEKSYEIFYSVKVILRAAMEEMGIDGTEVNPVWMPNLTSMDNLLRFVGSLRDLFSQISNKRIVEKNSKTREMVEWIHRNSLSESLTTYEIAREFNLSERKVYDLVKEYTGQGIHTYILKQRMKKAAELLCSTNISVAEIAQKCGYPAESTFYRVFKKYYGVTPFEYRTSGGLISEKTKK